MTATPRAQTVADERRTPPRSWPFLLAILLAMGIAPAYGQLNPLSRLAQDPAQQEGSGTPAEQNAEEPAAIPLERIPSQLEPARELARRASDSAAEKTRIREIEQRIREMQRQVDELGQRVTEDIQANKDMRGLEDARERILTLRRVMTPLRTELGARADELASWRTRLDKPIRSWQLTADEIRGQRVPAELLDNVEAIEQALAAADSRVAQRQKKILALQSTMTGWLSRVDELLSIVETELSQARAALFQPEQAPIWQAHGSAAELSSVRQAWRNDWHAIKDHLAAQRGSAWAYLGLLVFLLAGLAALASKARLWSERTPALAENLSVFRHPVAAALVLAIMAGPSFFPGAPMALREFFGVLVILPLIGVMRPLVPATLRRPLYLVAGLYFLAKLQSLLGAGTGIERYYQLLLAVAAAAALAWLFRPKGPAGRLEAGGWWRAAKLGARLGLVLLAVAVFANIGGLVSLSSLITNAVISSVFGAVLLFAGVVVVRAVLLALLQTPLLQRLNLVRWHTPAIDAWVLRILSVLGALGWLLFTVRLFRAGGMLERAVSAVLFSEASFGAIAISLGDILAFIVAIWAGLLLSRLLRFVLNVDVFPRITLPRGVAATIAMLVNYVVLGIAVVIAVAAAGIQMDRFAIIVGALSVGIGFGLQNVVNNFVSGLILAFERPIQSGDTIEFSSMFGSVTRIGVRSSTVRTFDGAEVIVPNANLIANEVTNWTLSDQSRRIEIMVGVAYGTNPHQVLELLLDVARHNERVGADPEPAALFLGFGDSSLDFSLRCWTDDFNNYLGIKSELTLAVHDALYQAGMEIPFPQRDLHLRSIDSKAVARIGAVQSPEVGDDDAPRGDRE